MRSVEPLGTAPATSSLQGLQSTPFLHLSPHIHTKYPKGVNYFKTRIVLFQYCNFINAYDLKHHRSPSSVISLNFPSRHFSFVFSPASDTQFLSDSLSFLPYPLLLCLHLHLLGGQSGIQRLSLTSLHTQ